MTVKELPGLCPLTESLEFRTGGIFHTRKRCAKLANLTLAML